MTNPIQRRVEQVERVLKLHAAQVAWQEEQTAASAPPIDPKVLGETMVLLAEMLGTAAMLSYFLSRGLSQQDAQMLASIGAPTSLLESEVHDGKEITIGFAPGGNGRAAT